MGREFIDLFDHWAESYDNTVHGGDEEYVDVFAGYTALLKTVAEKSRGTVLEFGVGTGNLTATLLEHDLSVIGVEPSREMRKIATDRLPQVPILDGDFLNFSIPAQTVDTIVSTYAFHHLTDEEKEISIRRMNALLPIGGTILFADTAFRTEEEKQAAIERANQIQYLNLAQDLATEYYTTLGALAQMFSSCGFDVSFSQWNDFVWIFEAVKTAEASPAPGTVEPQ